MIYPAIDLMGGQCVRLFKGDFNQRTDYDVSPLDVAKACVDAGAEWLHVVDLDGAKRGKTEQSELIMQIAKTKGLKVQTGGGLRDLANVQTLLNGGVERVVIGSLALTNPQMIKFWLKEVGPDKIVLAFDVHVHEDTGVPYPASQGWTERGKAPLWTVLEDYMNSGLKTILVTDIGRDGVMDGANVKLYQSIQNRFPDVQLITSGGVGNLDHVKDLKSLNPHGIIIGKALYENRFTLAEALAC